MRKLLKSTSIITLLLFVITSLNIQPVHSFEPVSATFAGGGSGINPGVQGGVWTRQKQGLRISVVGDDGQPAFTCNGKDSMDFLFSDDDIEKIELFGDGPIF